MTARVLVFLIIVCGLHAAHATDMRTVPPMHAEKIAADVELKGRELEAERKELLHYGLLEIN